MSNTSFYQPYRITYYPEAQENPDFIILCPHGYMGDNFFRAFPDFRMACHLRPQDLRVLFRSEADFGATELSHKTAELIAKKGLKVAVFESLLPREIIDSNRVEIAAIQPLFEFAAHMNLYTQFFTAYREMDNARNELLKKLKSGGRFLAMHTMRSFELSSLPPMPEDKTPDMMKRYYQTKLLSLKIDKSKISRTTCLVTKASDEPNIIVDYDLLESAKSELKKSNIPFKENDPYPSHPNNSFYHITKKFGPRGLCIDFIKDMLSKESPDNSDFDLANLTLDNAKVDRLAKIMADAIFA